MINMKWQWLYHMKLHTRNTGFTFNFLKDSLQAKPAQNKHKIHHVIPQT